MARETVRWIREVLADPDGAGGFGASQDADTGAGDDGDYFTWTREELAALLGADELAIALARFGIGSLGRMPHDPARNVLFTAATAATLAERFGRTPAEMERLLDGIDGKLRAARARRTAPFVDRTAWQMLMDIAPASAGMVVAKLGSAYAPKSCGAVAAKALSSIEAKPAAYTVWVDTKGHPGDLRGKLFAGMAHM